MKKKFNILVLIITLVAILLFVVYSIFGSDSMVGRFFLISGLVTTFVDTLLACFYDKLFSPENSESSDQNAKTEDKKN